MADADSTVRDHHSIDDLLVNEPAVEEAIAHLREVGDDIEEIHALLLVSRSYAKEIECAELVRVLAMALQIAGERNHLIDLGIALGAERGTAERWASCSASDVPAP